MSPQMLIMADGPRWTDVLTAIGTVGASAFAAVGTWISLKLYKGEKQRRKEDQDRFALESKAAEEEQARLLSAWTEPGPAGAMIVVKNGSTEPIPHCVVMYRTHAADFPEANTKSPFLPVNYDFGLLSAGEERRVAVNNVDAEGDWLKRPVFVAFTDSRGKNWLYDRGRVLHRVGANGEIARGTSPELDRWMKSRAEEPPTAGPIASEADSA